MNLCHKLTISSVKDKLEQQLCRMSGSYFYEWLFGARLRVVSNFGDGDCGAGEIHTCASESSRRRDAKGAPKITGIHIAFFSNSSAGQGCQKRHLP